MKKLPVVFLMLLFCLNSKAKLTEFGSDTRVGAQKVISLVMDEKSGEPLCQVIHNPDKVNSQYLIWPECGLEQKQLVDAVHIDGVDVAVVPLIAVVAARFLVAGTIGCVAGVIGGGITYKTFFSDDLSRREKESVTSSMLAGGLTLATLATLDLATKFSVTGGLTATACSFYTHKVISIFDESSTH